jgi:hypothetical protein
MSLPEQSKLYNVFSIFLYVFDLQNISFIVSSEVSKDIKRSSIVHLQSGL